MGKQTLRDKRINDAYAATCGGVQIPLMKITDVFKVGDKAITAGADDATLRKVISDYVQTIRMN